MVFFEEIIFFVTSSRSLFNFSGDAPFKGSITILLFFNSKGCPAEPFHRCSSFSCQALEYYSTIAKPDSCPPIPRGRRAVPGQQEQPMVAE
jgi:hypothetical protein